MTTESQIEEMKAVCEELKKSPYIKEAEVDDWGKFGNFQIVIYPAHHNRQTTLKLKGLVNSQLKDTGAHLRQYFAPEPYFGSEYDGYTGRNKRVITGYNRKYWLFDIDYQQYDAASNSFS